MPRNRRFDGGNPIQLGWENTEAEFEGQRLRRRGRATRATNVTASGSLWLAPNPSKRWGELFFLLYTPFWLTLCLKIIFPYMLYQRFTKLENLLLGLFAAAPTFLVPLVFVGKEDRNKCLIDRYWLKANIWIIIFSYVGNYFWTHYFFTVLGASNTYPSWKMNNVPHTAFLLTHTRYLFYHMVSNLTLRRLSYSIADLPHRIQFISKTAWILTFSFFIAYLEILAVSNLPYYDFVDRESIYKIGSIFYAIFFVVSLPLFSRVAENEGDRWDLSRVVVDALGAAMLVTIILELFRKILAPIFPYFQSGHSSQPCFQASESHISNGGI